MADFDPTAEAIETRFKANWPSGQCPIVWDNGPTYRPPTGPYCAFQVQEGESRQVGMPNMVRNVGLISIELLLPKGSGTKDGRQFADEAAAIFDRQLFSGVQCRVATVRRAGQEGERFRFIVTIPFFTTTAS